MKNTKKTAAVVITAVAITVSASALASATGAKAKSASNVQRVFNPNGMGTKDGFRPENKEAVVTATLGIDATTLRNRLMAGESLATIAGTKKDALIAALVADETKQIDAAVTAGKLTAAQAATLKANLTAHVTDEVNAPGFKGGTGPRDGKGSKDGFRPDNKEAVITATLGIDATTLRNRLMAGESLATIAGAKKDSLIAALVADESKQIDAAVTAGKLTAAQAATLKANLTAHVTEEVNETGFRGGRGGDRDGMDGHMDGKGRHGHDRDGMRGQGPKPTTTTTSSTSAN